MEVVGVESDEPRLLELIAIHKAFCVGQTPPGSGHAVTPETPGYAAIRYWLAVEDAAAIGCIGLKPLAPDHAEIKTMHVREGQRGRGVADALLAAVVADARGRGVTRLSLETGRSDAFLPSRRFYERAGFRPCPPFGAYADDPFSVCMSRGLKAAR